MNRDKEMSQIVCHCKTCGDPITKYYYVGYPYCDKCRRAYNKQKFEEERSMRGNKDGAIIHLHKHNALDPLEFEDGTKTLCGQTGRSYFGLPTLYDRILPHDNQPICIRCIKIFAKQIQKEFGA